MDRLRGIEVFARVVDEGSFTGAARSLNVSKSHVSKQIRALEDRLGARLLQRTTRKQTLTDVGEAFYQRCASILGDLEEAELAVSQTHSTPHGTLRLTVPLSFGLRYLGPALTEFLERHPTLRVDLNLSDRFVDLVDEGFDLAVRIGRLADSSLIARKLAPMRLALVASPAYWQQRGRPQHPSELKDHDCLRYTLMANSSIWRYSRDGEEVSVKVAGRLDTDNGDVLALAAEAGLGVAQLPTFLVRDQLQSGRLEAALCDWTEPDGAGIWAVYPHNRHLSAKVRVFVDFLVERFRGPDSPS